MDWQAEQQRNQAAYARLKQTIAQNYPRGWFVGVDQGQVLGAAADFCQLEILLREQGRDPREVLVVEAGVDYPQDVTILSDRPRQ